MTDTPVNTPLEAFFTHVGRYLAGEGTLDEVQAAVGPAPSPDGLAYYAWLVKFDQQRILGEMFPSCKRWLERLGVAWDQVAWAFCAEHPPAGWSVPHLGERFPDWLLAQSQGDPARYPVGIEAIADLTWTRFLARNAPDGEGLGMDQRVHVRQYRVDAVAVERAVFDGKPIEPRGDTPPWKPTAMVVYRHASGLGVRTLPASLATIVVLVTEATPDAELPGVLATVPAADVAKERARLVEVGCIPA
jgi:hypothetical protein